MKVKFEKLKVVKIHLKFENGGICGRICRKQRLSVKKLSTAKIFFNENLNAKKKRKLKEKRNKKFEKFIENFLKKLLKTLLKTFLNF